jgi:hypothetical protein
MEEGVHIPTSVLKSAPDRAGKLRIAEDYVRAMSKREYLRFMDFMAMDASPDGMAICHEAEENVPEPERHRWARYERGDSQIVAAALCDGGPEIRQAVVKSRYFLSILNQVYSHNPDLARELEMEKLAEPAAVGNVVITDLSRFASSNP